jgi:hypothetical protein
MGSTEQACASPSSCQFPTVVLTPLIVTTPLVETAGAMADGKDFLSTLSAAVKAKNGGAGTPAPTKTNKK